MGFYNLYPASSDSASVFLCHSKECLSHTVDHNLYLVRISHRIGHHFDHGIFALYFGSYIYSASSVIVQIKMALLRHDQIYVTVNSTVKGKVCFLGIYSVIFSVIHQNLKFILLF